MTMNLDQNPTAWMEPWLSTPYGGRNVLFGYCLRHETLGGRSWSRSSPLVQLDERRRRALTQSGRVYIVKRRISTCELPDDEARTAFALLVGPASLANDPADDDARRWLQALKMGRRLRIAAPDRSEPAAIVEFLERHRSAYLALVPDRGLGGATYERWMR